MSHLKKAIPDSVQNFWHECREGLRRRWNSEPIAEGVGSEESTGDEQTDSWGIQEAAERNKTEASKSQCDRRLHSSPMIGEEDSEPSPSQVVVWSHRTNQRPGLTTQLALAYAIHKSIFIFVRVPLAVAITPKVVKVLRSWGWQIGKRRAA